MALGLAALLDDIAAIAKTAASSLDDIAGAAGKASTKAVGVVVDDTAVTPQYVHGLKPARELPLIWRIAKGSLRNKLIIIVAILAMNQWAPFLLTPLLMLGGTYLCFEGAEKVIEWLSSRGKQNSESRSVPAVDKDTASPTAESATEAASSATGEEDRLAGSAIRTDFILSAEIMVIALNEIKGQSFGLLVGALLVTAVLITALVYGTVGILVKIDDLGMNLIKNSDGEGSTQYRFGRGLVKSMPTVMAVISVVGTFAMMWVGGHLVVQGAATLGFTPIADFIHHLAHVPAAIVGVGGLLAWLVDTLGSMICGFLWGSLFAIPVIAYHRLHRR